MVGFLDLGPRYVSIIQGVLCLALPISVPKRKITLANLTLSWTRGNAGRLQLVFLFSTENGEDQLSKKLSINLFVQARSLDCGARRREA